jgi:hypothetical protein
MKSILAVTLFVSFGLQQVGCTTPAENHSNLGETLQVKGDCVLARKEFEEALRLIPQMSWYQASIKTIQSSLSDLDKLQP